ncbi:MAG: hypothetical protein JWN84_388 [Nocardioides sp.]|nr:hypothetical protein [Nocardioides sp.]
MLLVVVAAVSTLVCGMAAVLVSTGIDRRHESRPVPGGVTTTGTVTAVEQEQSGKGPVWFAVAEYVDDRGRRHTTRSSAGDEEPRVGAQVRISYDPERPEVAHDLTTGADIWKYQFYGGVVLLVLTAVTVPLGVRVLVVRRRRGAHQR